jgi:phage baseplate assembly protein W
MTMRRERFNQPLVGTKLAGSVFEFNDPVALNEMKSTLEDSIRADEPRAQNVIVTVQSNPNNVNEVRAAITFSMVNIPEQISFEVILKRAR